jgi:hypothetical protein
VRVVGVSGGHRDEAGGEQPVDLTHGVDQLGALPVVQWGQEAVREVVGALVEDSSFGLAFVGEPGDPYPPVLLAGLDGDQVGRLQ